MALQPPKTASGAPTTQVASEKIMHLAKELAAAKKAALRFKELVQQITQQTTNENLAEDVLKSVLKSAFDVAGLRYTHIPLRFREPKKWSARPSRKGSAGGEKEILNIVPKERFAEIQGRINE